MRPRVNQPAPAHGVPDLERKTDGGSLRSDRSTGFSAGEGMEGMQQGSRNRELSLESLHGEVVLIHTMGVESEVCRTEALPLMRDLLRANEGRGLTVITFLLGEEELELVEEDEGAGEEDEGSGDEDEDADDPTPEDELAEIAKRPGVEHPLAFTTPEQSPYFQPQMNGITYVTMIGRSGEVAWAGNPVEDQKQFLATLRQELVDGTAPALSINSSAALDDVLDDYYEGRWASARRKAEKRVKQLAKAEGQAELDEREDLQRIIQSVTDAERDHLADLSTALGDRKSYRFYWERNILLRAFPKGETAKAVEEMSKRPDRNNFAGSFIDAERYFEFAQERPVLFPVRKSRDGDKFARKLEKFLRKTNNSVRVTQEAKALLEVYVSAR